LEHIIPQIHLIKFASDSNIPDNSARPYSVWGNLLYLNGTGIPNEAINMRIFSLDRQNIDNFTTPGHTFNNGYYSHNYNTLNLE
jgi:hypothetical protein